MTSLELLDALVSCLGNALNFMLDLPCWLCGLIMFILFPNLHISSSAYYEMQYLILSNETNDKRITESESEWFLKGILHGQIHCAVSDPETAKQILSRSDGKKAYMQKYLKGLRRLDQEERNAMRRRGALVPRWRVHSLADIYMIMQTGNLVDTPSCTTRTPGTGTTLGFFGNL